mgnify:CR=1 FL=1
MLCPSPPGHDLDSSSYRLHEYSTTMFIGGTGESRLTSLIQKERSTAEGVFVGKDTALRHLVQVRSMNWIHFAGSGNAPTTPHAIAKSPLPKDSLTAVLGSESI